MKYKRKYWWDTKKKKKKNKAREKRSVSTMILRQVIPENELKWK